MRSLTPRTHEEELARVCKFEGCTVSLSYETRNKIWCGDHSDIGRNLRNKERRRELKIVPKPEVYNPDAPVSLRLSEVMTILYEDYKEPLKTVKEAVGDGYGYMGTVAMTEDRQYIQCHICGDLFISLTGHVRQHKMTIPQYKKEFGLSHNTRLIGDGERYRLQQAILSREPKGQPEHLKKFVNQLKSGDRKVERGDYSLEWRNKKGLCPDQVLEKVIDLKEKLGRIPSHEEFYMEYKGRYLHSIAYLHGSWSDAVRKLGEKTREDLRRHSEEDLVLELQDFQERYGRIPMTSDFNRGLLTNKGTFIRKFGTLNNARIAAGMNAIIPMGGGKFGNYKEITPEEYSRYLEGHGISDNAKRQRAKRAKRKGLNG